MLFSLFKKNTKKVYNIRPTMLLILDGWGISPPGPGNAISVAQPTKFMELLRTYPSGSLIASGESVGLPANEVGNTEVGHLTMGTGRVVFQDLVRIDKSIQSGSYYVNPALVEINQHLQMYKSRLHIMCMVGTGNVHSSMNHLYATLEYCRRSGIKDYYLHLFTDGRDSDPKVGMTMIKNVEQYLSAHGDGKIATVSGRYYAMDRDRRWERTKLAYDAIVSGKGVSALSAVEGIERSYQAGKTDEFIEPMVVANTAEGGPLIKDNDAVFFVNFRVDRPRQLAMALSMQDFESSPESKPAFKREYFPSNLFVATMTEYQNNIPVNSVAFKPQIVHDSLPAVIANSRLKQLHMAESEKERFVTYYFRGMVDEPCIDEDILITPSPQVATYDKKPEMSFPKQVEKLVQQINKDKYHFIVMNVANADMVAHSGNLEAAVKACKAIDQGLGAISDSILNTGGTLIITADHGNAEQMLSYETSSFFVSSNIGKVVTDHTNNPVPVIIARRGLENQRVGQLKGALSDIAPTILNVMGITPPKGMTGKNLLTNA